MFDDILSHIQQKVFKVFLFTDIVLVEGIRVYIICMHEHEIVNQYDRAVIINNTCTISTQNAYIICQ